MCEYKRVLELKSSVKKALRLTDGELEQWWDTPFAIFDDRTARELCEKKETLRELEIICKFSINHLKKYRPKVSGEVNHPL